MSTAPIIELDRVEKTYRGGIRALRGVSMRVEPGQIFGLLGPNGAGKSTLVKILLGIVHPSECRGTMLGAPVGDRDTRARVGYLPEHVRFPEHLTGAQALHYIGRLLKVPARERSARAGELLEHVNMTEWADTRVGRYSKGMKQRLGIAQSLMGDPDLVFLDEPTDGVDPMGRRQIREMLLRMREQGKTVVVNSHLLGEVESVTDQVAILVSGLVRRLGTVDELAVGKTGYVVEVEPRDGTDLTAVVAGLTSQSETGPRLTSGEHIEISSSSVRVETRDAAKMQPIVDACRAAGLVVTGLAHKRPSLEDLFVEAVRESESEGGV